VNGSVRARPAALAAFAERARDGDLEVVGVLDAAREVVARYLASGDPAYVHDPGGLLADLEAALEGRLATAEAIGELGRAFAALDRPGWMVVEGDEHHLARALADGSGLPEDLTTWLAGHDERRWHELLAGVPGGRCPEFTRGRYEGGGFLRGPDGDLYPLVVPQVVVDGRLRNAAGTTLSWAEVETLHGEDDAWVDVARRTGTTRFGPEPSLLFTILAAFAGMNPNLVPTTRPIPRGAVDALGFGDRGLTGVASVPRTPRLEAPPPAPEGPLHGPPAPGAGLGANPTGIGAGPVGIQAGSSGAGARSDDRRPTGLGGATGGEPGHRRQRSVRAAQARGAAGTSGLDAIVTLGEGLTLASSMRDNGLAHVDVRFQRTADGRRRAIARSVTGRTGAQGTVLLPTYLTADEDGALQPEPMRADPHLTMGDPEHPLVVDWGQHREDGDTG
jgi:hypothetical protein